LYYMKNVLTLIIQAIIDWELDTTLGG